ncbi:MAG TPA: hypothetical protein VJM08_14100, partial [Anaerolineales bacterium]|nr:hypothetical protein [Anaerolineales bacterium]
SKDGSILLWETDNWSQLGNTLTDHTLWTNNVIFTPDGNTLISFSDDGNIILWDITNSEEPEKVSAIRLPDQTGVNDAVLNPKVPDILVATGTSGNLILWDISNREQPAFTKEANYGELYTILKMAISEDGELLASGDLDGTIVLWDMLDPRNPVVIATDQLESNVAIYCVAISPNGNILASGNEDGSINLWDISNPREPSRIGEPLMLHEDIVNSLAFGPDGRTLATGSFDGKVLLLDTAERTIVAELFGGIDFTGFLSPVNSVIFNPEGNLLAAGVENGSIVLWDVSNREEPVQLEKRLQGHASRPYRAEFSEDGRFLTLFSSIPRLDDPTEVSSIVDVHHRTMIGIGPLKFKDPNGKLMVFQVYDADQAASLIKLIDPATGKAIGDPIRGGFLSINTDKGIIVFQTNDESGQAAINLWDIDAQKQIGSPVEGKFLALSKDGELLVYSNSEDDTSTDLINVLNITTREPIGSPLAGEFIALSSTHNNLIYRSTNDAAESIIYVWNIVSGAPVVDPFVGYNPIPSANGSVLLYQTFDDLGSTSFQLLDIETGFPIGSPFTADTTFSPPTFSPEGNILSYQTYDKGSYNFNFLNAFTGEEVRETIPGESLVSHWAGDTLVFEIGGSAGSRIVLIDSANSVQIGPTITGQFNALTEDGNTLIYQGETGIKHLDVFSNGSGIGSDESIKGDFEAVSPDGSILFVRNGDTIQVRDLKRPPVPGVHLTNPVNQGNIQTAALSPDGKTLAVFSDGEIVLQDSSTLAIIGKPFNQHFAGFTLAGNFSMFSPDGNVLVITNNETKVTSLWDVNTGEQIGEDIQGEFPAFSPDGKTLQVSDYENSIVTSWEVNTGKRIGKESFGKYSVPSPNGKTLAAADVFAYTVILSDVNSGEQLGEDIQGEAPVFSPDGNTLKVLNYNTNRTTLWDVATGEQIGDEIPGTTSTFSPDSKILAVSDFSTSTITLWDTSTGEEIGAEIKGESSVFSPKGNILTIINPVNSMITLWDANTGEQISGEIPGTSSTFSADGKTLAVGDYNTYTITLWDASTGEQIGDVLPGETPVFSPVGNILAIADPSNGITTLRDVTTGKQVGDEIPGTAPIFSSDGNTLAVGDSSNITLWEVSTGEQIGDEIEGVSPVFSPKGNILTITDPSNTAISLWDINLQEQTVGRRITNVRNGNVSSVQFSPDGMTLASIGEDGILLTDVGTQHKIAGPFPGENVVFSPNSDMIAYPISANVTSLRDISNGKEEFISGSDPVFSPDGLVIASQDKDDGIIFWNLDTLAKMNTDPISGSEVLFNRDGTMAAVLDAARIVLLEISTESTGSITFFNSTSCPVALDDFGQGCAFSAAFSPDGKTLAYTDGAQLLLWNPANDNVPPDLLGDSSEGVVSLAYIQDGRFLISEDFNSRTTIWDLSTHAPLEPPVSGSFKVNGYHSNSDTFLIERAGNWFVWKFDPADWIKQLCSKVGRSFTPEEWANYFPGESFRRTCSN